MYRQPTIQSKVSSQVSTLWSFMHIEVITIAGSITGKSVIKAWQGTRLEDGPGFPMQWQIHRNFNVNDVVAEQESDHVAGSKISIDYGAGNLIARSLDMFESWWPVLCKVARKANICDWLGDTLIPGCESRICLMSNLLRHVSIQTSSNLYYAAAAWIEHIVWADA